VVVDIIDVESVRVEKTKHHSRVCSNGYRPEAPTVINVGQAILPAAAIPGGFSDDDQNPALHLAALKKVGCQTVSKDEGLSGATTQRPALLRCLRKLEHGDTLSVWKLGRPGGSLRDLITMLDDSAPVA
jgi:hypothetical protein